MNNNNTIKTLDHEAQSAYNMLKKSSYMKSVNFVSVKLATIETIIKEGNFVEATTKIKDLVLTIIK